MGTTKYAPAEREEKNVLINQAKKFENSGFLEIVLSKMPLLFFILNDKRQIIYTNELLIQTFGYKNLYELIGYRPGELFKCIHSENETGGCGTSESCRVCGAVQAVLESQKQNKLVIKETRLTTLFQGNQIAHDYEVISKPFIWENEQFYMVALNNINDKKHKERLERIFFHDLLNKAGAIHGLLEMINKKSDNEKLESYLEILIHSSKELLMDIEFQHDLSKAQKGELKIKKKKLSSVEILKSLKEKYVYYFSRYDLTFEIDDNNEDISVNTDPVILDRILLNLIKNAVESSEPGETIKTGIEKINNFIRFWIYNPTFISNEIQLQIFQRSFSTKGIGRGIGTFSIKLFTEQYLNGKVHFISTKEKGTTFYVDLPLE